MSTGYGQEVWGPWQDAVRHGGVALLLLAAACAVCAAIAGWLGQRVAALDDGPATLRWRVLCLGWATLAAAFAWRLDVLLGSSLRFVARQGGWYAQREGVQVASVVLAAIGTALVVALLPRGRCRVENAFTLATTAMGVMLALRVSSLHAIDSVLAQSILGASAGRLAESGLLLLALAAGIHQLMRH